MLSLDTRKAILGIAAAVGIIFVCNWAFGKKDDVAEEAKQPPVTDANIEVAVEAYRDATSHGEDVATLQAMNRTFKKDFGITVFYRQTDGKYVVRNLAGNNIRAV